MAWTSVSQPVGDGTCGGIPKDSNKVRTLTQCMSRIESLYLNFDLTNPTN